jgi:hypothetical protein
VAGPLSFMAVLAAAVITLVAHDLSKKPLGFPEGYVDRTPTPEAFIRQLMKDHPELESVVKNRDWITQLEGVNLSDAQEMKKKLGETFTANGYQVSTEEFVANLGRVYQYFNVDREPATTMTASSSSNEPAVMRWVRAVEDKTPKANAREPR